MKIKCFEIERSFHTMPKIAKKIEGQKNKRNRLIFQKYPKKRNKFEYSRTKAELRERRSNELTYRDKRPWAARPRSRQRPWGWARPERASRGPLHYRRPPSSSSSSWSSLTVAWRAQAGPTLRWTWNSPPRHRRRRRPCSPSLQPKLNHRTRRSRTLDVAG